MVFIHHENEGTLYKRTKPNLVVSWATVNGGPIENCGPLKTRPKKTSLIRNLASFSIF